MGQLTIPDNAAIYLDTAPVIYSVERAPGYWNLLEPLWDKCQAKTIRLISSELLLLETLVFPIRSNNQPLIKLYEELLTDDVQLIKINSVILRTAAEIRAVTSLKTPDAIHAATALNVDCTLFLTNDAGLRTVPGLSVTVLKDVLDA